jgi:hypothetical protein
VYLYHVLFAIMDICGIDCKKTRGTNGSDFRESRKQKKLEKHPY